MQTHASTQADGSGLKHFLSTFSMHQDVCIASKRQATINLSGSLQFFKLVECGQTTELPQSALAWSRAASTLSKSAAWIFARF